MLEGLSAHPALARFEVVQELASDSGSKTLLAKSKGKGGSLVTIRVLVNGPIPEDVARALSKEGSAAARLGHDAIVQTRALILEDDLAALVSEFVPGASLQRILRFASGRGVRLPDDAAWYVVERVLAALASAHGSKDPQSGEDAPIVHRAVSPGCVVVGWDGAVKLGDFGLSKLRFLVSPLVKQSGEAPPPPLVSPEQARGTPGTTRSDVFCAALLAARLATGRTPYARHRDSAAELMIAMSEASVLPLSKTRPDLPDAVKRAFDRALEADPDKRDVTAQQLLDAVRASFDPNAGKASLVKILERWRAPLEKTATPWEKRASLTDASAATAGVHEGALILATADDRPSVAPGVRASVSDADDEPWNKRSSVPKEEAALAATDPVNSVSRLGAVAEDVLSMPPPLPAMRITMPSLPVYGGPVAHLPPPKIKKRFFSGGVAAATILVAFALLLGGSWFLLTWLSGPS